MLRIWRVREREERVVEEGADSVFGLEVGMKLNREKSAALLAAGILVLALWDVVAGLVTPGPDLTVDITLPAHSRDLIPQEFRSFTEVRAVPRNPFPFAEGWQSMETIPLPAPPLPSAARVIPLLGSDSPPEDVGFLYQDKAPAEEETP
jgi:hypothetical protein